MLTNHAALRTIVIATLWKFCFINNVTGCLNIFDVECYRIFLNNKLDGNGGP